MGPLFSVSSVIKPEDITGAAWFSATDGNAPGIGPRLLERVAELGSLRDAAAALGLDEDLAWNYLVAANNLSEVPLLRARARSLTTTADAYGLLGQPTILADEFQGFLNAPDGGAFRQFHQRRQLMRRLDARTSARNQFYCRVRICQRERVNAVVTLALGGGDRLVAQITTRSAEELGLESGLACHALIDPAWVEVLPEKENAKNARDAQQNALRGKVVRCQDDPVDAEVTIELTGGRIVLAAMTRAEMQEKDIREGKAVRAVIQSSQIILAVETQTASTCAGGLS